MESFTESASIQMEPRSEPGDSASQPRDFGDLTYPLVTIATMLLLLGTLWVF